MVHFVSGLTYNQMEGLLRGIMKRICCTILLCFAACLSVSGQVWRDKVSRENSAGNSCYREKSYSEALEKYVAAQDYKKPRPEISYNIANTLYQQKKYTEALKEYGKSVSAAVSGLEQKVCFNKGNSYYQMGQYQAAAESYQKALEIDSKDRDAKHNLELALKKLEESQQKQESKTPDKSQRDKSGSSQEKQDQSNGGKKEEKPREQAGRESKNEKDSKAKTQPDQSQRNPRPEGELNKEMDQREALRILDAINDQEKKEQQKQILRLQRSQPSGRDW